MYKDVIHGLVRDLSCEPNSLFHIKIKEWGWYREISLIPSVFLRPFQGGTSSRDFFLFCINLS